MQLNNSTLNKIALNSKPAAAAPAVDVFFQNQLHPIGDGLRPVTAAGLNGVLVT